MKTLDVRSAEANELDALAQLWLDGWRDAHADLVPPTLKRLRTLESFRHRLEGALPNTRVAAPDGTPIAFYILKGSEIYQFYVSAASRGTGVATALMIDAEARLVERGVDTAWLACAIGNHRAARFYEKCGWHRAGTIIDPVDTSEGPFPLEVWRYEKPLRRTRSTQAV
jgi:GNAT superfamily N-acetyltransferase